MRETEAIRKLYYPFHPVTKLESKTISYSEFRPHENLQPFIFHYWEMKTVAKLERAREHRVIPNGCVDIYFDVSRPYQSFITGLSNRYSSVTLADEFHYVGICFVPTVAPQLYRLNGSELRNHHETLADVAPSTARYIRSTFSPGLSQQQIKELLDIHFIQEISRANFKCDPRLLRAVCDIFKTNGHLRIESDLDVGLSTRQLRRVFDIYVGDNPKSFARTVRFQKCLRANAFQSDHENLFYDFGYYDQVHYIKEFKRLYGTTPAKGVRYP